MQIGLGMHTHGLGSRDDQDYRHQPIPAAQMQPLEIARLAEEHDFHSLWFGDHIAMPPVSPDSVAPLYAARKGGAAKGTRHYAGRPELLDGAIVMGAVAATTSRIKMASGVLIAPYRHPLSDARQFGTIDNLSHGRLIMGVGVGWMKEEFEALGRPFASRSEMTAECIEIYKRAWTQDAVTFHGRFFDFESLTMDPKPVQQPRPPIVLGGVTRAGARLAARSCDGLYPIFLQPHADPHDYDYLLEEIRREAEGLGRDLAGFALMGIVTARITDSDDEEATRDPRRVCGGTAEQILADLQRFADAGYSLVVIRPVCPSGQMAELRDQIQRLGDEVLPAAAGITIAGEWKNGL